MAALRGLNTDLLIPNFPLLGASSLLLMIGYAISAANWAYIVNDLGGPQIPKTDAIRLFMMANLGRYIPGKIWQITGLAALAKDRGVAPGTAVGAAVLGQGIALVVAAGLGIGVYDTLLPSGYSGLSSSHWECDIPSCDTNIVQSWRRTLASFQGQSTDWNP